MVLALGYLTRQLVRVGAVAAVAATLGACSIIPEWMGGDSGSSDSADQTFPDQSQTQTADASQPAANGQFPDLADTPDRPAAPSTSDQQKQVAGSLGADRASQSYSADQLRAGTEAAAAPPGAAPPPDQVADVDAGSKSSPAPSDSAAQPAAAPPPSDSAAVAPSANVNAAPPAPAPAVAVASAPIPAPPPSGGLPAVPAVPVSNSVPGAQSMAMTDSALGFQPSRAPPLDASVAQFVPQSIMSRYQQTASLSGAGGVGAGMSGGPAVSAGGTYAGRLYTPPQVPAMGGPEQMTGAVVANFDALNGGGGVAPSSVYANPQGLPPVAVVLFRNDTTILSADAKGQVRSAADSFNAHGGTGYVRVVGHAASASSKVSEARRLQIDFEHSQARATAVARELIKDGVPPNKILVDAVGGSQPVYSDVQGQDGNRRAEIFIQG